MLKAKSPVFLPKNSRSTSVICKHITSLEEQEVGKTMSGLVIPQACFHQESEMVHNSWHENYHIGGA